MLTGIDRSYRNGKGVAYVLPTEDEWYKAAYFKPDASGYSLYANGSDDVADLTRGTVNGWNYNDVTDGYVNDSPNHTWETGFGAEEQNGTYDMMGNVWELTESKFGPNYGFLKDYYAMRGDDYTTYESQLNSSHRGLAFPVSEEIYLGFRVAAIPEPMSASLIILVFPLMILRRNLCSGKKKGSGQLYMHLNKLFCSLYSERA